MQVPSVIGRVEAHTVSFSESLAPDGTGVPHSSRGEGDLSYSEGLPESAPRDSELDY